MKAEEKQDYEDDSFLEERRCPACRQSEIFIITAITTFELVDTGTGDHGDVEFAEESPVDCGVCPWRGLWWMTDIGKNPEPGDTEDERILGRLLLEETLITCEIHVARGRIWSLPAEEKGGEEERIQSASKIRFLDLQRRALPVRERILDARAEAIAERIRGSHSGESRGDVFYVVRETLRSLGE